MKKLKKSELNDIKTGLPDLKIQLCNGEEFYKYVCVSVFDKWLTEEECEIIFTNDEILLLDWRKRFENAIIEIFNLTDIYLWRKKRHNRISYYRPKSLKHLLIKCDISNQTWRNGRRYDILLPEFSAFYSEEWDWTNIIWYKDFEKVKPILDALQKAGLHILPNKN